MFSPTKNLSCTWSICADVYTELSGNFHPIFHYIWQATYLLILFFMQSMTFILLYFKVEQEQ